jgi:mannose-6-phosphate isomerase-like protein (cupin superfamily)
MHQNMKEKNMTTQLMVNLVQKTFERPDEVRQFPKGRIEYSMIEETRLARITLEPGWKWSKDVRPLAETGLCQSPHLQYVISGRLQVEMEDSTTLVLKAGDFVQIPPGHDAWVLGKEPFVAIDLTGMRDYIKK